MMKIYMGSDHGGFVLKTKIKEYLQDKGYTVEDRGCENSESCDYPDFGVKVGESVVRNKGSLGIVICGSGIGISIATNKVHGARAALCNSIELAKLARKHNGANILAMGERTHFVDKPITIVDTFLSTSVDPSERHERRRNKLDAL